MNHNVRYSTQNLNINDNHITKIMEARNSHHIATECPNPANFLSSSQSGITIPLSREDILAIYEEGPEAVVALVQTIFSKQAARIAELEERLKLLEDQINCVVPKVFRTCSDFASCELFIFLLIVRTTCDLLRNTSLNASFA